MRNSPNFIPIRSGRIGQILKKDTERLLSDILKETDDIICNPNSQSEWYEKQRFSSTRNV